MIEAGTIKKILRPFRNPTKDQSNLIRKRLTEAHPHLLTIRDTLNQRCLFFRITITNPNGFNQPAWLKKLLTSLSYYLSMDLVWERRLIGDRTQPVYAVIATGDKDQCLLARHYIDYLVLSVGAFVKLYGENLEKEAKEIRKINRKNPQLKVQPVGDIRLLRSDYRTDLVDSIDRILRKLLEDVRTNHQREFAIGNFRKALITKRLKR